MKADDLLESKVEAIQEQIGLIIRVLRLMQDSIVDIEDTLWLDGEVEKQKELREYVWRDYKDA